MSRDNGGLPWWLSGKESVCQCSRHRFDPWIRKIPWRRKWEPVQYSCLENPTDREARSLAGYSSWGHKRIGSDLVTEQEEEEIMVMTVLLATIYHLPTAAYKAGSVLSI